MTHPVSRPGTNPIMCQCCGQIQQHAPAPAGPTALVQPHGQPSPQWFTAHQPQYGQPGPPHQPAQLHPFIMQPAAHPPLGPRLCPRAAQLGMRCHVFLFFFARTGGISKHLRVLGVLNLMLKYPIPKFSILPWDQNLVPVLLKQLGMRCHVFLFFFARNGRI